MKVILRASEIPDESTVTKLTGKKEYILRSSVKIYGTVPVQEIKAELGAKFIVSENGNVNAIPGTVELVVKLDRYQIIELLEDLYDRK